MFPPTGRHHTEPPVRAPNGVPARALAGVPAGVLAAVLVGVLAGVLAGCGLDPPGLSAEQSAPAPTASGPGASPPVSPGPGGAGSPSPTPSGPPTASRGPISPTPAQLAMMRSITAVFENDRVTPQYAFIADQDDGCGYTAGWIGFCTKYGDLLDVVKAYNTAKSGDHPLRRYTRPLQRLADDRTDDVRPLGKEFTKAWKRAAADPLFRRTQVEVGHKNYLDPALKIARDKGVTTALGLENLFDTALMMGPSETACDGVLKISAETDKAMNGNPAAGVPEADWIRRFNEIRIRRLQNPCTPGRKADWPRAVGRPRALQDLADSGNWNLTPPIRIAHGHNLTITEQTIAEQTT